MNVNPVDAYATELMTGESKGISVETTRQKGKVIAGWTQRCLHEFSLR